MSDPAQHSIQLCTDDVFFTPLVVDARGNPAFPVDESPEAYKTLDECQVLVDKTLEFLGTSTPVQLKWHTKLLKHGVARRKAVHLEINPDLIAFVAESFKIDMVHEACHVADMIENAGNPMWRLDFKKNNKGHGPSWKALMERCGVPVEVYARD